MNHTCTNCGHVDEINPASALRSIKSETRSNASKANGAKGGRPRKITATPINVEEVSANQIPYKAHDLITSIVR